MASSVLVSPVSASSTYATLLNKAMQQHQQLHCFTPFSPSLRTKSTAKTTLDVRCLAKENPDAELIQTESQTGLSELFAFGGAAPERINGRLAMVGFVAAMAVEVARKQDLMAQISEGGGGVWFVGMSVLLSLASLVPLVKGITVKSKSEGVMTDDAEMLNGRMAMLGLVALAITEYAKGGGTIV